jgi:predicted transposase/invertase (TIGR01784 family)
MKAKYINPFTDFGFKKIFGEEASKPLLIDFLNALLPQQNKIIDLSFKNTEQLAIYDIYCENENGEKFIVELQKAKQNYFKERTIYYSTFPKQEHFHFPSLLGEGGRRRDEVEQAEKGNWNYNLRAVYCVGILDFTFDDYENEPEKSEVVHTIKLKNQSGKTFYDKLTYIYLEMPNFNQTEAELKTRLDKWLYFIKHLEDFQTIPAIFKDEVFTQAFEKAELAKFDQIEMDSYEYSLKIFRDNKAVFDYARDTAYDEGKMEGTIQGMIEGKMEGKIEGKIEVAKALKKNAAPVDIIIKSTGLSESEINKL